MSNRYIQNSDVQILYIGPDENITDVRQRLEYIEGRHVVLVISAQTQLRGQVTWKLLSIRAQELSQDICIVSTDPYVCAMAQSVRLRVVSSLSKMSA